MDAVHRLNSARSWVVLGVGMLGYVAAVLQRSTLGVASVQATERFGISATVLSTLAVVQLVVYAGLQVPVGVLIDRVGPKALLVSGAFAMAGGQLLLAEANGIGAAVIGRILVGAGDACTFISVVRLLPSWFGGSLLPQVTQWTGTVGQLGQVLSAIPFSLLLHTAGWTPAFLSVASVSAVAMVLLLLLVSNGAPPRTSTGSSAVLPPEAQAGPVRFALAQTIAAMRRPGTQLGFWSHFTTQSSGTVLALLWGFPFLSVGLGYGSAGASALLVVPVAAGAVAGPVLGILTARHPLRRSTLVLGILSSMAAAWTVLLLWPGRPPVAVVVLLLVVVGVGGPGSLIGLDFARTFNPLHSLGSATGVVNAAGFIASFLMTFLIGAVLDLLDRASGSRGAGPSALYGLERFRIAFCVQYVVVGAGTVLLLRARHRTRRRIQEDEGITVAPLWVVLGARLRRRTR